MKIGFRLLPFTKEQVEQLTGLALKGGYEPVVYSDNAYLDPKEMTDTEALIGYFPTKLIAQLPCLKWIQTPCAGVERFCKDIYQRNDAVLTNCSGAFGIAIAEYMITGLLMLMRKMPEYYENQKQGLWQCMGASRSIYGSRIVVVGMGDIGTAFAARAKAMGAYIRGVCRTPRKAPACYDEVYSSAQLKEAVYDADAVVLCVPATPETQALFSRDVINALPCKAIVANCGRGYTIDQAALSDALKSGRIAGAVLDVFETEPLPKDDPLWKLNNVVLTPHVSGRDGDPLNTAFIFDICRENLSRFIEGRKLLHVVDRTRGY